MPPKGAPNVLLIMTDDQGYGVSGTFGGVPRELLDAWAVRVASEPHYGNIPRAPDEGPRAHRLLADVSLSHKLQSNIAV